MNTTRITSVQSGSSCFGYKGTPYGAGSESTTVKYWNHSSYYFYWRFVSLSHFQASRRLCYGLMFFCSHPVAGGFATNLRRTPGPVGFNSSNNLPRIIGLAIRSIRQAGELQLDRRQKR